MYLPKQHVAEAWADLELGQKQLVLMPINNDMDLEVHEGGTHWALLVYARLTNTFYLLDSLETDDANIAHLLDSHYTDDYANEDMKRRGLMIAAETTKILRSAAEEAVRLLSAALEVGNSLPTTLRTPPLHHPLKLSKITISNPDLGR
jgi:hypothetical protein